MENEWIINKEKRLNLTEIYHKHECFYFRCYRFFLGRTFAEDKKGPLCSFCLREVPNYILFQFILMDGFLRTSIRYTQRVNAYTISKSGNVYGKGYISFRRKYIIPQLGEKKKEILNRLFDEFISKYR